MVAGLVQAVLPPEIVAKWVGENSGLRGLIIAAIVGALTPGGPMTSFPIVVAFYMSGADRGALVSYITGWSLLAFSASWCGNCRFSAPTCRFPVLAVFWLPVLAGVIARRFPFGPPPVAPPRT